MKRKRFSEEQVVGILKEHEAEVSLSEPRRIHGVSDANEQSKPLSHYCVLTTGA